MDDLVLEIFDRLHINYKVLGKKERRQVLDGWRKRYCYPLWLRTGKWSVGKDYWSVLPMGITSSRRGARAVERFSSHSGEDYFFSSTDDDAAMLFCEHQQVPRLSQMREMWSKNLLTSERLFIGGDLSWTFLDTHEYELDGCYYCEEDWIH